MTAEQITTIAASILQGGGVVVFLYLLLKGIMKELQALKSTIDIQEKAISTMEKRVFETEKIGEIYKNLVSDLPKTMQDYKAIITRTRDEMNIALEQTTREREDIARKLNEAKNELQLMKNSGEQERRKQLQTTIFLYQDKNKDLAKFLNSLSDDQEHLIQVLAQSDSFDDFLHNNGIQLTINDDPELERKLFAPKESDQIEVQLREMKSANLGLHGLYILMKNNKVIIDEQRLVIFREDIARLRQWKSRA